MVENERYRIGISGSYGGLNLGDEAILEGILQQLRATVAAEVTVFSRNPEDTLRRHAVERAVPVRSMSREEARAEIERLDLLVLGGGGILYDGEAEVYLREVAIAESVGVPVVVYAISAGPLASAASRKAVATHLRSAARITVRDRGARKLLEEVGIHNDIHVTADPALLIAPEPLEPNVLTREGLDGGHELVGMSVREPGPAAPDIDVEHYHALLANVADFMVSRYDAQVVFVPMERKNMDLQQSHAVVSRMKSADRATVLKGDYSPGQLLTLIGHFEFGLGMRLHFLIFSAMQGIPFVPLPYASKVQGFIEDLEIEMPPLEHVTTGHLIAHIDRSWDVRASVRDHIRSRVPPLQARARETNQFVLQVLRSKPPKEQGPDLAHAAAQTT
ncbi:MAG TPA: polysaccharide pyruvyl transferase family protein [Phycisphaerae bacterium]|nr:polysaccharide pyruvyl transferase family protein [Phycisphaerae bacterium]HOJ75171.1 polysaccharide pyruvyl transferase family protein [Phycisphaerae bacterium]HOM52478.1 polysaccharide pyruvyl transferase family protein [Phycisphaerae bacterium]HON66402.1 polysaccharide pyruvyl transferase family protein [Phycisphaerae bacterium]HOQ85929.1 polysaccharide pyruvyl transferase family protein [Phycisphaerae bacterium]